MIRYVNLGTNDLERSVVFYDAVLGTLGHKRYFYKYGYAGYGDETEGAPTFWVNRPFNRELATAGNGTMVALAARTRAEVRAFYEAALANCGTSEGEPGLRPHYAPNWYAAYVRDPDGNKLAAVCLADGE